MTLIRREGMASAFDLHHSGSESQQRPHLSLLLSVAQPAGCRLWSHRRLHPSPSRLMGTLSMTPAPVFTPHLARAATSAALQKQQALFLDARRRACQGLLFEGSADVPRHYMPGCGV